jgi:FixJ family two-component response regulator
MRGSVYLVEDDDGLREALSIYLSSLGCEVHAFRSADDFVAAPIASTPSVVVTDVNLPGISGLKLQKRKRETCRPVPFVFISGALSVTDGIAAMKGGALEFLVKPVDPARLAAAIEQGLLIDAASLQGQQRAAGLACQMDGLSPRERQVHALLVRGANNTQIMEALGVSIHTAKQYKSEVLRKFEVSTLAELIDASEPEIGSGQNGQAKTRRCERVPAINQPALGAFTRIG